MRESGMQREQSGRAPPLLAAGLAGVLLVLGALAVFASPRLPLTARAQPTAEIATGLPKPVPQPITRTTADAQVAWLWVQSPGQDTELVAVNPSGQLVARLSQATAPAMAGVTDFWRSADGSAIVTVGANQITSYSARDGAVERTYARAPGNLDGYAFSPNGRWLAVLLFRDDLRLQVIDLQTGASQMAPIVHDPNARLPGMSRSISQVVWGMPVFASDSTHLYLLTDWGGPSRLTAFSLAGGRLNQTATKAGGQGDLTFPSCAGPAMVANVVAGGQTLVAFCHVDGAVWFFDLSTLTSSGVVQSRQPNPFWLSPIFTPDGQLLYLHQWPGFGDTMQVVDLRTLKLLGPVSTPTKLDQQGAIGWLFANAYAGGVASTVPVSPDGLKLYVATGDGVLVLRVPDLKPVAKLAPGLGADEAWVSGDGRTIYATADGGKRLAVMRDDGSDQKAVTLPGIAGGFIASEHG